MPNHSRVVCLPQYLKAFRVDFDCTYERLVGGLNPKFDMDLFKVYLLSVVTNRIAKQKLDYTLLRALIDGSSERAQVIFDEAKRKRDEWNWKGFPKSVWDNHFWEQIAQEIGIAQCLEIPYQFEKQKGMVFFIKLVSCGSLLLYKEPEEEEIDQLYEEEEEDKEGFELTKGIGIWKE